MCIIIAFTANALEILHNDGPLAHPPNCGHDGDKLVVAIEWALWFVSQTRDSKEDTFNETLLKISKDIVGDVDSLARELSQCSEHMKKEIQRLDSARNHALNALKIRLDVLSNINRG